MPLTREAEWCVVIRMGHVVTDDVGRIPLFVTAAYAAAFTIELDRLTGDVVFALSRTAAEIVQLRVMRGLTEQDVYDFEATAQDAEDALRGAVELTGRCARPLRPLGGGEGAA